MRGKGVHRLGGVLRSPCPRLVINLQRTGDDKLEMSDPVNPSEPHYIAQQITDRTGVGCFQLALIKISQTSESCFPNEALTDT